MSKPHARIRAEFKEIARRIIANDRHARKYGLSQNTIGEIERALFSAFKFGIETRDMPTEQADISGDVIDWIKISVRARATLWSMTVRFSSFLSAPDYTPSEIERVGVGNAARWFFVHSGVRGQRSVANGSVAPLIQLGLITPVENESNLFKLTEKGMATCAEYWRRDDARDPTLPIMSTR